MARPLLEILIGNLLVWIALGPAAAWLGYRIRIGSGQLARGALLHLLGGALALAIAAMARALMPLPAPALGPALQDRPRGPPPWVVPDAGVGRAGPPPWIAQRAGEGGVGAPPGHRAGGPPGARAVVDGLLYALFASLGTAMAWARRARSRERDTLRAEVALASARLANLQLQLNPHFLFNALNSISSLIQSDPRAADDMVGDLSTLLRAALDTSAEAEISLARELALLDCYLAIEHRRHGASLQVTKDIDPETLNMRIPTLLLQPLVENAIRHGIAHNGGVGIVRIAASIVDERLRIVVADNGAGLPEPAPAGGIGLANIRSRIEQLYGRSHEFTITNANPRGCVVTVVLPARTAKPVS